ncbi:hypothetical protein LINPERPRIM_LOCUS40519 [Linum perenne]
MRPWHYERPDYDAGTILVLTLWPRVDKGMVRWVMRPLHYERPDYDAGVYGGIFEYLWMVPGEDIHVGLKPLHCDANVRSLTKGVTTLKTICVRRMMKRLHKQRVRLARLPHDVICLIPARKLKVNKGKLAFWYPVYNGEGEFEVHGERTFVVKLHQFECACGSWQIYGIPSEHAIACINYNGEKLVDFVHDAFLVGTYNQSYSVAIRPLNDS